MARNKQHSQWAVWLGCLLICFVPPYTQLAGYAGNFAGSAWWWQNLPYLRVASALLLGVLVAREWPRRQHRLPSYLFSGAAAISYALALTMLVPNSWWPGTLDLSYPVLLLLAATVFGVLMLATRKDPATERVLGLKLLFAGLSLLNVLAGVLFSRLY